MTRQDVEKAKVSGDFRKAGQMQAILGDPCSYGCHYGMRSTREAAVREWQEGYAEAELALRLGR